MDAAWPRCLERLEAELPADEVHTWLRPLQAEARDDGLTLYAPNAFVVDRVREHYLARIRELMAHFSGSAAPVSVAVGSTRRQEAAAAASCRRVEPTATDTGAALPLKCAISSRIRAR